MDLQKINVKFFVADPRSVSLETFIQVFHSWIQASNGEYYDLADYSHVNAGPGILLVAHNANVSMDNTGDRPGLLYNRKRPLDGTNLERLKTSFVTTLNYCRKIEAEPALEGRVRFRGDEALVIVNDRLSAPNTDASFSSIRSDLETLARVLYDGSEFSLEREQDPQRRLAVRIKTPKSFDIPGLLKNVENNVN